MSKYIILDEHNHCWTRRNGVGFWTKEREVAVKYFKWVALFWIYLMRAEGIDARLCKVNRRKRI